MATDLFVARIVTFVRWSATFLSLHSLPPSGSALDLALIDYLCQGMTGGERSSIVILQKSLVGNSGRNERRRD
jgi:hypothetical protein